MQYCAIYSEKACCHLRARVLRKLPKSPKISQNSSHKNLTLPRGADFPVPSCWHCLILSWVVRKKRRCLHHVLFVWYFLNSVQSSLIPRTFGNWCVTFVEDLWNYIWVYVSLTIIDNWYIPIIIHICIPVIDNGYIYILIDYNWLSLLVYTGIFTT